MASKNKPYVSKEELSFKRSLNAHGRLTATYIDKMVNNPDVPVYNVKSLYHYNVSNKMTKENRKLTRSEKKSIYLEKEISVNKHRKKVENQEKRRSRLNGYKN